MTNYYSNKEDFSAGSGTNVQASQYGSPQTHYSVSGDSELTTLLSDISEVAQVVTSEGLSSLYHQTGDASLGKDMPSSTFTSAYDRVESLLTSAKKIHSEILERIDGKFTKGIDNSLNSLNQVNGTKKPYQTQNLTYQKKQTYIDREGRPHEYETTEYYSLADILDHKTSPIKATQEVYQKRLANLRDMLTEANGRSAKEVKKYKGMSDEELMNQFYKSGPIGDYSGLKHFQWQEDNKEWLEPVEKYLGIGLVIASFVSAIVSWGTTSPLVGATATAVGITGTAYTVTDGGYSAITGNTLISGTPLDTDDRIWAGLEALTAAGTLGVGKAMKVAGAADDTIKVATKAVDVADDATNLTHIGYNAVVKGEDPTLSLLSFSLGKGVSSVKKHVEKIRAKDGSGIKGDTDYQNYVIRKKANGEYYLSEADWTKKTSTLSNNTQNYAEFKVSGVESFKEVATDVETNITIEVRNAAGDIQRVQVKAIGFDEAGNIRIQEYTTAKNGLSANRQSVLEDLSKHGGTVVGKGKGAFTGGTEIKPGAQIDVVSQKTAGTTIKETVFPVKVPKTHLTTAERYDELPIVEYAQKMGKPYTSADVEELTRLTTHNANSDTALLGTYSPDTSSYEQIAHENGFTYFDAGSDGWKAISKVDSDLPYSVNDKFLQEQIDSGKDFILTHDPDDAREVYIKSEGRKMVSYNNELDILEEHGYRIVKEGQFWRATK